MTKETLKKLPILIVVIIILLLGILFIKIKNNQYKDTIKYEGKTYVLLEYNMDIFTYYFNSNDYYEEDIIYPIPHDKWNMVYFNGDLFVFDKEVKEATKYYADDNNYEWFIVFDNEDDEIMLPIKITEKELKFIYNMENIKKEETKLFEEIKRFATLTKVSKDKTIFSLISLAYYDDSWYWKTEIIDVNKNNDPEYVIKLPNSLNKKITKLYRSQNEIK